MLKRKDIFLLEIIEKVTVVTSTNLCILGGYHDVTVVRKRLRALIDDGYVAEHWFDKEKLYFLTGKGLSELDIHRKAYECKGFSTEHYAEVSAAAAWFYTKSPITSIYDMAFDRDIKRDVNDEKYRFVHLPDIIYSHRSIEIELNRKTQKNLDENFINNTRNFIRQTWILPSKLSDVRRHLEELALKHNADVRFLTIEQMHEQLNEYVNTELKNNSPRTYPMRKIEPSPKPQALNTQTKHNSRKENTK